MEKYKEKQDAIEQDVNETLAAWYSGGITLEQLRVFDRELGELNRQAATSEHFQGDVEAARFMHQVTRGALRQIKSRDRRTTMRVINRQNKVEI